MQFRNVSTIVCCLILCGCSDRSSDSAATVLDEVSADSTGVTEAVESPAVVSAEKRSSPGGVHYVPRVSEQKMSEFLDGLSAEEKTQVTEEQVFAIMGGPTRRDDPITGQRDGQTFTMYEAYWEEPGSGISSSIGFVNGRMAGMTLGLEVSQ